MPTYGEAQVAIENRLKQNWTDNDVLLRFENEGRREPGKPYIQTLIKELRTEEVGYAGNKILYRRFGLIWAQCFWPAKEGTKKARDVAQAVIDIYEGQQFSQIICREGNIDPSGDDGKGFWQVNAKIEFDHDFERTY